MPDLRLFPCQMEDAMQTYRRYQNGLVPPGSLVVRLYHAGDQIRGFIREVQADEPDAIFASEELEVENALRLAENKQLDRPDLPIYIELKEGVRWDPAWGRLQ
jgi:hypothetical protein